MRGTVVYIVALTPDSITEIDRAKLIRMGDNRFVPVIACKAKKLGGDTYETGFPVVMRDIGSEAELEALRVILHQKVDQAFDKFKERYREEERSPDPRPGRYGEEDEER